MKKFLKDASDWMWLLPILFLASCKGSAFGGGLFIIPWVTGITAAWTWGRYFLGWRLPFAIDDPDSNPKRSKGSFWFAIILTGVTIGAILLMLNEK